MTRAQFIQLYANFRYSNLHTFCQLLYKIIPDEVDDITIGAYKNLVNTYFQLTPAEIDFFDDIEDPAEEVADFLSYHPDYLTEEWNLDRISILKGIATLECYQLNNVYPYYEEYYTDKLLGLIFSPCETFCNQLISPEDRQLLDNIKLSCDFNLTNIYTTLDQLPQT